jgi:uncharacterized protein YneF (UPF0154 family)
MQSLLLPLLLISLATSLVYAETCLSADNCGSCALDSTCATCETGYGLYDGQCHSCPSVCTECTVKPHGSSLKATCTSLYWYIYLVIGIVVLSIIIGIWSCFYFSKKQIVKKPPRNSVAGVQMQTFRQQPQMQITQDPFIQAGHRNSRDDLSVNF